MKPIFLHRYAINVWNKVQTLKEVSVVIHVKTETEEANEGEAMGLVQDMFDMMDLRIEHSVIKGYQNESEILVEPKTGKESLD